MARKPRIRADELPPIVEMLRQIAARLDTELPQQDDSKEQEQWQRLQPELCEAGLLFLAAWEAGAFGNDTLLSELLKQSQQATYRKAGGSGQDHLEFHRIQVIEAVVEKWMPERCSAFLPDEAHLVYRPLRFAATLATLADKIETVWALSQPSGSFPAGWGNAGQGKTRLSRENAPKKVRCAGAHPAISTNENGADTPAKVRTDGTQSPKTDKPARWFGRSNWIHGIGPTGPFIFKGPPPKRASQQPYAQTSDVVLSWIGDDIFDDLERLDTGKDRYERINLALRVWRTYPIDVFDIGCRKLGNKSGYMAQGVYIMLNELHKSATACLMLEADKYGLDPAPLGESAEIKEELYAGEPWRYFGGRIAAWPDCMGKALDSLPASKQQAIREAENVLRRLEIKWQVEEARPTLQRNGGQAVGQQVIPGAPQAKAGSKEQPWADDAPKYPPLTDKAAAVLKLLKALPVGRGMKGPAILDALNKQNPPMNFDQSTLTKRIIPELRPHGVKNRRGVGYYIDPSSRRNDATSTPS